VCILGNFLGSFNHDEQKDVSVIFLGRCDASVAIDEGNILENVY